MKRLWMLLPVLAAAALAQDKAQDKPQGPKVERLFVMKYADPQQISNLLRVFTGSITPNSAMHALAVESSPEAMTAIEDAIKRLDVPSATPKDIELTAYLVVGNDAGEVIGAPIPKDLDGVVTQLRSAFAFKNYGLLDVLNLRSRSGQRTNTSSSGGAFQINGRPHAVTTQLVIDSINIESDGATVRIDGFNASSSVPFAANEVGSVQTRNLQMRTDLDIKEGQRVVVGRLGINPGQAMFVILTAKVL